MCILCVRVIINKRSFEPFCVWISDPYRSKFRRLPCCDPDVRDNITSDGQVAIETAMPISEGVQCAIARLLHAVEGFL